LNPTLLRRLPLLWLGLAGAWPGALRAGDEVAAAWELVGRHLANDALAGLTKLRANGGREAAFAEAVMRMDAQPVTEAGLKQVEAQLTELARGSDEIAAASAYLIGRLYQAHFFTPDYARAGREYAQLAEQHPQSYWAQLGLVKLALLQLYLLPDPAEPGARVAAAEALLPRLTIPDLRRDAHIVIGRASLFHAQPMAGVLAHLVEGDRIGGLTGLKRVELQLQIAELSRRAGRWEQARVFFQRFVDENDVDARVHTVKVKLEEIAAHQRAAGKQP
jgi:hypothetical protein